MELDELEKTEKNKEVKLDEELVDTLLEQSDELLEESEESKSLESKLE